MYRLWRIYRHIRTDVVQRHMGSQVLVQIHVTFCSDSGSSRACFETAWLEFDGGGV